MGLTGASILSPELIGQSLKRREPSRQASHSQMRPGWPCGVSFTDVLGRSIFEKAVDRLEEIGAIQEGRLGLDLQVLTLVQG
jgi:hypothetical protein